MTKYWLAISNHENWEILKKNNIWGVSRRNPNAIAKINIGDLILIYVSSIIMDKKVISPVVITGAYESLSSVYEDTNKIFLPPNRNPEEVFPLRIKLKPISIFLEPVEFKPLIPKLNFIKNKKMWNGHIRGKGIREIPEVDFNLIIQSHLDSSSH
jgi:predicted RNA-binding protein